MTALEPCGATMSYGKKAYVEHVALRVRDIDWHVDFFREVLGMSIREETGGDGDATRQVWTIGGLQLIADPDFTGPEGRLAHLGIMVEDQAAVLREARQWGVKELPQGNNWLALPDGLNVEILQAAGTSVSEALAIDPRAEKAE
jgi:catechol 2,3-dioxygenase-like lactoylglutathione lyase family enzyme